jgi:hypothetical protein
MKGAWTEHITATFSQLNQTHPKVSYDKSSKHSPRHPLVGARVAVPRYTFSVPQPTTCMHVAITERRNDNTVLDWRILELHDAFIFVAYYFSLGTMFMWMYQTQWASISSKPVNIEDREITTSSFEHHAVIEIYIVKYVRLPNKFMLVFCFLYYTSKTCMCVATG